MTPFRRYHYSLQYLLSVLMSQRSCCCSLMSCFMDCFCCCCECNKFVFPAPRQSEYTLGEIITGDDDMKWEFKSFTSEGRIVPYVQISNEASRSNKKCFIYFHGNGEDVGLVGYFIQPLVKALAITFYAIEYPTYGHYYSLCPLFISNKIKEDSLNFYRHIRGMMGRSSDDVFVMGRSIGSGGATYLAGRQQKIPILVLMSPFDTIKRVARTHFGFAGNFVKQHFNNEEEIVKFKGRLLVIHGQRDQIIDIRHSRNLVRVYQNQNDYKNKAVVVEPEYMTHNNFNLKEDIFDPISAFLYGKKLNS